MNLVVLGASGGCGRLLVEQAVARGHRVRAVVRESSTLAVPDGVEVLRGDLASPELLQRAFDGQDAVLCALGLKVPGLAPWLRPEDPTFLSRAAPAIVDAMRATGVRRLVAVSAGGVGDSRPRVPAFFRALIATTTLRFAYAELERFEAILLASGLDVCLCRPSGLTDGPRTGNARILEAMHGPATISRADVAAWMLDAVEAPSLPGRTPMITVTG